MAETCTSASPLSTAREGCMLFVRCCGLLCTATVAVTALTFAASAVETEPLRPRPPPPTCKCAPGTTCTETSGSCAPGVVCAKGVTCNCIRYPGGDLDLRCGRTVVIQFGCGLR